MENIKQNKMDFFRLYEGQKVMESSSNGTVHPCHPESVMNPYINFSLRLKNLSDIDVDEDAIFEVLEIINMSNYHSWEVAKTADEVMIVTTDEDGDAYGGKVIIEFSGNIWWDYHNREKYPNYELNVFHAYQYLIKHGYAVPHHDLPIQEQLDYKWMKFE